MKSNNLETQPDPAQARNTRATDATDASNTTDATKTPHLFPNLISLDLLYDGTAHYRFTVRRSPLHHIGTAVYCSIFVTFHPFSYHSSPSHSATPLFPSIPFDSI